MLFFLAILAVVCGLVFYFDSFRLGFVLTHVLAYWLGIGGFSTFLILLASLIVFFAKGVVGRAPTPVLLADVNIWGLRGPAKDKVPAELVGVYYLHKNIGPDLVSMSPMIGMVKLRLPRYTHKFWHRWHALRDCVVRSHFHRVLATGSRDDNRASALLVIQDTTWGEWNDATRTLSMPIGSMILCDEAGGNLKNLQKQMSEGYIPCPTAFP